MLRSFVLASAACSCLLWVSSSNGEEPVHVLVPGFSVTELPVRLTNVNNLLFTPDRRLLALGYDGRVHVLRARDGDGLQETSEPFWDEPTLKVPVGMAWSAEGLYVASQGKVSLLRDTDDDGRADREDVLASGWPRTDVASGGVDAAGLALDQDGNLYFGLMCANYSNPYRLKDGKVTTTSTASEARFRSSRPTEPVVKQWRPVSACPTGWLLTDMAICL